MRAAADDNELLQQNRILPQAAEARSLREMIQESTFEAAAAKASEHVARQRIKAKQSRGKVSQGPGFKSSDAARVRGTLNSN